LNSRQLTHAYHYRRAAPNRDSECNGLISSVIVGSGMLFADTFNKIVGVLGIGFLQHLHCRVPVVFTRHPKELTVIINVQKYHRISRAVVDGNESLLMAVWGS
jgi:hypothetical protein